MEILEIKYKRLKKLLSHYDSLIVAYSGGVDSALVLKVAHERLGDRVIGVTADSPSMPRRELKEAKQIAETIGAQHLVIPTRELENENYVNNSPGRCYFCKSELYSRLLTVARKQGIRMIANGTNVDDLTDYRPGLEAAKEYRVVSPLKEAELTKAEVRRLAKMVGLDVWDKPASPCLSSRIPYGSEVTPKKLMMIEEAEDFLKDLGIRELRVRHLGKTARIEVNPKDFSIINFRFRLIRDQFRRIGFQEMEFATFKSGSLNLLIHAQNEN